MLVKAAPTLVTEGDNLVVNGGFALALSLSLVHFHIFNAMRMQLVVLPLIDRERKEQAKTRGKISFLRHNGCAC